MYTRGPSSVNFETYPVATDLNQTLADIKRKSLCENIEINREGYTFTIKDKTQDITYTLQSRSTSGFKIESRAFQDKVMIISQKLPIYYDTKKYRNCSEECSKYNKKTSIMIYPRPNSGLKGVEGFIIRNYRGSNIVNSTTCGTEYKRS